MRARPLSFNTPLYELDAGRRTRIEYHHTVMQQTLKLLVGLLIPDNGHHEAQ